MASSSAPANPLPQIADTTDCFIYAVLQGMQLFGPIPHADSRLTLDIDTGTRRRSLNIRPVHGFSGAVWPLPRLQPEFLEEPVGHWVLLTGGNGLGEARNFRLILVYDEDGKLCVAVPRSTLTSYAAFSENDPIPVSWAKAKCLGVIRCMVLSVPCAVGDGDNCILAAPLQAPTTDRIPRFLAVKLPRSVHVCPHGHWDQYFFAAALDTERSLCLLVRVGNQIFVYSREPEDSEPWVLRKSFGTSVGGMSRRYPPNTPSARFCSLDVEPGGVVRFEEESLGNRAVLFNDSLIQTGPPEGEF